MKYGYSHTLRPFGYLQKRAWFYKEYIFNTEEEGWDFILKFPRWKKHWPFDCRFFIIPEEEEE